MTVSFVVVIWVMFGAVVPHVGGAWFLVIMVLTLTIATTEPMEAHVHGFHTLGDNGIVHGPGSCGVVSLDGQLWLRPIHLCEFFL